MFTDPAYGARLGNPAIPKVCLLITDGGSNLAAATQTAAATLRGHDVAVFAIGAGGNVQLPELNGVATDPDEDHVVTISSASNIGDLVDRIAASTCVQAALIADCIQVNDTVQPGEFRYFTPSFANGSVLIEVRSVTGVSVYVSGTDDSPGYNDVDIYHVLDHFAHVSDHFAHVYPLCATPYTPCAVPILVPMPIGC